MPTVHLICGSTGAGKTTYAIALTERAGAIRFSIDEWMAALFVADAPATPDLAWGLDRTGRCEVQIWEVSRQVLARGLDVVLDLGLSKRAHRDRFRALAREAGAPSRLHYLDVDRETRRARVRTRNAERTGTFSVEVTDFMFDFMEGWFEPPDGDELEGAAHIVGSGSPGA